MGYKWTISRWGSWPTSACSGGDHMLGNPDRRSGITFFQSRYKSRRMKSPRGGRSRQLTSSTRYVRVFYLYALFMKDDPTQAYEPPWKKWPLRSQSAPLVERFSLVRSLVKEGGCSICPSKPRQLRLEEHQWGLEGPGGWRILVEPTLTKKKFNSKPVQRLLLRLSAGSYEYQPRFNEFKRVGRLFAKPDIYASTDLTVRVLDSSCEGCARSQLGGGKRVFDIGTDAAVPKVRGHES